MATRALDELRQDGDVLKAQGNLPGALKAYRDSLAIREKVSTSDPDNAERRRDLVSSYLRLATIEPDKAWEHFSKARDMLRLLSDSHHLAPTVVHDLEQLEKILADHDAKPKPAPSGGKRRK